MLRSITLSLVALNSVDAFQSSFIVQPNTAAPSKFSRTSGIVYENFGFDFAEDQGKIAPDQLLGEAKYKQWVGTVNENSFLNRQYNFLRRTRELNLLGKTAESGILSKLESNGLDLAKIEAVLPLVEKLNLLGIVGSNQQLLINGLLPAVVEGAPFLLPVIGLALEIGPLSFFAGSSVFALLEYELIANQVKIPFVGLDASFYLGLLFVPLAAVLAGLGIGLTLLNANSD